MSQATHYWHVSFFTEGLQSLPNELSLSSGVHTRISPGKGSLKESRRREPQRGAGVESRSRERRIRSRKEAQREKEPEWRVEDEMRPMERGWSGESETGGTGVEDDDDLRFRVPLRSSFLSRVLSSIFPSPDSISLSL
ncbi:hypothetical protein CRG98_039981 [Punica granatum]|uniref:Uncharacterized protein n=1 Tax=Punica granatum TaxID=22663 RepID=A0A2I0I6M3_PUNGR|nr:hypothetical protein CRG98_039981 [Punica granatum]